MDISYYGNRLGERERVFRGLEREMEERDLMRRSASKRSGRRPINLTAEIDRYLCDLVS